ncbi:hypothetical protein [Aquimarina agarivorans]|uniref:hypothetical protein n=1 Tax=Aquimarina agarivorans TaxID=980584 RepID=UPI000248E9DA|nr:hypothetical protein [Aquimarina agarivorans]
MKNFSILIISLLFFVNIYSQSECNDAFSAANYSVAHTNNAYEATNTDHVQEWTEKAIETLSEVEQVTANCGCNDASNYAYEGIVAAEKSLEENTWERSRFYAKRAREKAKKMIDALSICANTDVSKYKNRSESLDNFAVADNSYDDDFDNIAAERDELLAEQEELVRLQKELKQKLELKKQEELKLKQEKHLELQKQLSIKSNAEAALAQIESAYTKLAKTLGCEQAYRAAKQNYTFTQQQLKVEKLNDTKFRYTEKLNEISEKAMLLFSNCASGF